MIWTLLKVRIRAFFVSLAQGRRKNGKGPSKLLTILLLIYVAGMLCVSFAQMFEALSPLLATADAWLYFAFVGIFAAALTFVLTVFAAQSAVFEAKDNELLLSMPIPPRAILLSRIGQLVFMCLLYEAFIVLPALFVWIRHGAITAAGLIFVLLCALLLPLLSTSLSCLVGYAMTALRRKVRHSNIVTLIFSILLLGGYFVAYMRINSALQDVVLHRAAAAGAIQQALYPFYCMGRAAEGNFLYFLLFALCAALPFALVFLFLQRGFTRITGTVKSAPHARYTARLHKLRSPIDALIAKDVRRFLSSPLYMMNMGLGFLMLLGGACVLLIRPALITESIGATPAELPLFYIVFACFCLSTACISAPLISLEGENLWLPLSLPLRPRDVLMAKTLVQVRISAPFVLLSGVLGMLACKEAPFVLRLMMLLTPFAALLFFACLGTYFNLHFPRFDWNNETQVVKQSLTVTATLFAGFLTTGAGAVLYLLLGQRMGAVRFLCAYSLLLLALALLLTLYLGGKRAAARFKALQ